MDYTKYINMIRSKLNRVAESDVTHTKALIQLLESNSENDEIATGLIAVIQSGRFVKVGYMPYCFLFPEEVDETKEEEYKQVYTDLYKLDNFGGLEVTACMPDSLKTKTVSLSMIE